MRTFRDYLLDVHEVIDIEESSLTRLKSKAEKGGTAIMSASRGNLSNKENTARARKLDRDIRGKFGKGATKVIGKYNEKDEKTGKTKRVKERSNVIQSGKMGKRKFKKAVKSLGKKYGQDSVITQQKGNKDATLKRTRKGGLPKRNIKLGKMRPGRSGENETQKKGKTFTYDTK